MPVAAECSNGSRSTAIRAIPRSMPSIGSSASLFAETRNYVQRVVENLQVYRKRFGAISLTIEPNLHRAANVELRPKPALVDATPEP